MLKFIGDDFVRLRREPKSGAKSFMTLTFGDKVEVLEKQGNYIRLRALTRSNGSAVGWARNKPKLCLRDKGIFMFSMVDVQQGDGMEVETPSGKIMLIDSGDNKLFARYVAARFRHRGISAANPLDVDALVITHGDADHFDGLNDFVRSESESGLTGRKRLFIHPKRVYHNGLVKAPGKRPDGSRRDDSEMFGRVIERTGETYIVDLHDDPRSVPKAMPTRRHIRLTAGRRAIAGSSRRRALRDWWRLAQRRGAKYRRLWRSGIVQVYATVRERVPKYGVSVGR